MSDELTYNQCTHIDTDSSPQHCEYYADCSLNSLLNCLHVQSGLVRYLLAVLQYLVMFCFKCVYHSLSMLSVYYVTTSHLCEYYVDSSFDCLHFSLHVQICCQNIPFNNFALFNYYLFYLRVQSSLYQLTVNGERITTFHTQCSKTQKSYIQTFLCVLSLYHLHALLMMDYNKTDL